MQKFAILCRMLQNLTTINTDKTFSGMKVHASCFFWDHWDRTELCIFFIRVLVRLCSKLYFRYFNCNFWISYLYQKFIFSFSSKVKYLAFLTKNFCLSIINSSTVKPRNSGCQNSGKSRNSRQISAPKSNVKASEPSKWRKTSQ